MKSNIFIAIMNIVFSAVEGAATVILAPLTLLTLVGLAVATWMVNHNLREKRKGVRGSQVWTRGLRRGA